MSFLEKYNWKKIMLITLWVLLAAGGVTLLALGLNKQAAAVCKGLSVEIAGNSNHFFIDKKDVSDIILHVSGQAIKGKSIKDFDLMKMEAQIKKDPWVNKAELYFDKDGMLVVKIEEKEPLARVFCMSGNSFYIDEHLNMLPLSERHSARLPIFTNFPTDLKVLPKQDSLLLGDVKKMSVIIQRDSFLMAMIDQVAINAQRKFELVPKIGEQIILFGNAGDAEEKFAKLKLFYGKVMPVAGLNKYKSINLQFKDQVVTTIREAKDVEADSVKTMQLIKMMAEYTAIKAGDTTQNMMADNEKNTVDVSFINQSLQREEIEDQAAATLPVTPPVTVAPVAVSKPADKKTDAVVKPSPAHHDPKPEKKPDAKNKKQGEKKPVTKKPVDKPKPKAKSDTKAKPKPKAKNDY